MEVDNIVARASNVESEDGIVELQVSTWRVRMGRDAMSGTNG